MNITLGDIGKKYKKEWIFKNVNTSFEMGNAYALLGPNGSGKSTLLKIISGILTPTNGTLTYNFEDKEVGIKDVYRYISITAPYLELIEEFTLSESIVFQEKIFPFMQKHSAKSIIKDVLNFEEHQHKQLKHFSSGMMQRVKLVLALLIDKPVILLDEPATNLDKEGIEWYHRLIQDYGKEKLVIVASNREAEYTFCTQKMNVTAFK